MTKTIQIKKNEIIIQGESLGSFPTFEAMWDALVTKVVAGDSYDILNGDGAVVDMSYGDKFFLGPDYTILPSLWEKEQK